MIPIEIPGLKTIQAEHLVLDYNGTLAEDGMLLPGVADRLNRLSKLLQIHVITADTFGTAAEHLTGIDCSIKILQQRNQRKQKEHFIKQLGKKRVIAIGNGMNDSLMLRNAALGIAVIQKEGASPESLVNADIICTGITDALELVLYPKRISATLRR